MARLFSGKTTKEWKRQQKLQEVVLHMSMRTLMCPAENFKLQELYYIDLDGEGIEFEALRTLPQSI